MAGQAREGGAGPGEASRHRRPECRLAGAGLALGLALLGGCTAARPPQGPLALGGLLLEPVAAPARAEPLVADLVIARVPARKPARAPLPVLRPRVVLIPPSPAKPRPPDLQPRVAWLPELKPRVAPGPTPVSTPRTIWPPPGKPSVASDWADRTDWAPSAGPPAAPEVPDQELDQEPDQASVSVGHGPAPRHDADRAVRVADRNQELDSLDQSAREALLAGDASTALRLYERLAREFPEARAARLGQALALERLGRSAEARAVYQSLLQADPEDLGAKIALLGILAERAPDEALQLLRRLARHHPDDHRLAAQIAMVLARTGDLVAAIAAGRQAVALDPGDARYRANLAVLLDRAGQRSAAIEQYQSALELATLAGAPTTQLGAIAARLHHLRQPPPSVPATPGR